MARRIRLEDIATPENINKIEEWCIKGLTNKQIAKNLGIALSTFYRYMDQSKEIMDALKKGKRVADDEVENALFKRAIGFKATEDKYDVVEMPQEEYDLHCQILLDAWKEDNPNWTVAQRDKFVASIPRDKKILVETKIKDVAPDTVAAIFWLKNRRPDEYRDKRNIDLSGGLTSSRSVDLSGISTDDLKKYAETIGKAIEEGEGNGGN